MFYIIFEYNFHICTMYFLMYIAENIILNLKLYLSKYIPISIPPCICFSKRRPISPQKDSSLSLCQPAITFLIFFIFISPKIYFNKHFDHFCYQFFRWGLPTVASDIIRADILGTYSGLSLVDSYRGTLITAQKSTRRRQRAISCANNSHTLLLRNFD